MWKVIKNIASGVAADDVGGAVEQLCREVGVGGHDVGLDDGHRDVGGFRRFPCIGDLVYLEAIDDGLVDQNRLDADRACRGSRGDGGGCWGGCGRGRGGGGCRPCRCGGCGGWTDCAGVGAGGVGRGWHCACLCGGCG